MGTRDKSKAEAGVLLAQRRIMAPLRNRVFHSLPELNAAILEQVGIINAAPFQKLAGSRQSLFDELDKPALRMLPSNRYEYGAWIGKRKVSMDYHVQIEKHYYSVPHRYIDSTVQAVVREHTVEIFHRDTRIAAHMRSRAHGRHTTDRAHMPADHDARVSWRPERFLRWARQIGPQTTALIQANFDRYEIPEQAYRRCMGILKLSNDYGRKALDQACGVALRDQTIHTRAVRTIIRTFADRKPPKNIDHDNIRGGGYDSPDQRT